MKKSESIEFHCMTTGDVAFTVNLEGSKYNSLKLPGKRIPLPESVRTLMWKYLDMCTRFSRVMGIAEEREVAFLAFPLRSETKLQNYLHC